LSNGQSTFKRPPSPEPKDDGFYWSPKVGMVFRLVVSFPIEDDVTSTTNNSNNRNTNLLFRSIVDFDFSDPTTLSPKQFLTQTVEEYGLSLKQAMDLEDSIDSQLKRFLDSADYKVPNPIRDERHLLRVKKNFRVGLPPPPFPSSSHNQIDNFPTVGTEIPYDDNNQTSSYDSFDYLANAIPVFTPNLGTDANYKSKAKYRHELHRRKVSERASLLEVEIYIRDLIRANNQPTQFVLRRRSSSDRYTRTTTLRWSYRI